MAKITIDNLVEALNAVANPEKEKVDTEKSILVVNGKIQTSLLTDKEVRDVALGLATSGAKIEQYAFVGNVEVDLPVYIPTEDMVEIEEALEEDSEVEGE